MSVETSKASASGGFRLLFDAMGTVVRHPEFVVLALFAGILSMVPHVGELLTFPIYGFVLVMASEEFNGQPDTPRSVFIRLVSLYTTGMLAGIAVGIGVLLLFVPGIYLAARFSLIGPAIMADGYGPIGALSESWNRTDDYLGTSVGYVFLVFVLELLIVFGGLVTISGGFQGILTFDERLLDVVVAVPLSLLIVVFLTGTARMYEIFESSGTAKSTDRSRSAFQERRTKSEFRRG